MNKMNNFQSALWTKLESFQIDEGDEQQTFEARLAKEQNWSREFARKVIEEYKRFVFLCIASGHGCTPSKAVDEVWHLHLTYTRSYWDRMCEKVLEQPLHHNPSKGGNLEDEKYVDWYARTLQSYRELLGVEPPRDIWGGEAPRRNETDHWQIPKKPATVVGVFVLAATLGGCNGAEAVTVGLVLLALVTVILIGLIAAGFAQRSTDRRSGSNGGCSSTGITSGDNGHSGGHHGGHCSGAGHCSNGDSGGGDSGGGGCGSSCGGGCGGGCSS